MQFSEAFQSIFSVQFFHFIEMENCTLYECNKDGWNKFMNENFAVEKGKLPPDLSFINMWLDMSFKNEGRDEFIDFLSKEGYISIIKRVQALFIRRADS